MLMRLPYTLPAARQETACAALWHLSYVALSGAADEGGCRALREAGAVATLQLVARRYSGHESIPVYAQSVLGLLGV